jgi:hypothetical protein
MYTYCIKLSQFSYNKRIFIEKNIDDKNILATFKKHSYFFKCEILKVFIFKECFRIVSNFQSFKSPLITYKWVIMYMTSKEKL